MVGLVLGSHGPFAKSIIESAELIFGKISQITSVCLSLDLTAEDYGNILNDEAHKVDNGEGVLILVDILGGTPSNQSLKLCFENENYEVVTGLNMSMLLQVLVEREGKEPDQLGQVAFEAGKEGVNYISYKLRSGLQETMLEEDLLKN